VQLLDVAATDLIRGGAPYSPGHLAVSRHKLLCLVVMMMMMKMTMMMIMIMMTTVMMMMMIEDDDDDDDDDDELSSNVAVTLSPIVMLPVLPWGLNLRSLGLQVGALNN
jgi:hypothetical protein